MNPFIVIGLAIALIGAVVPAVKKKNLTTAPKARIKKSSKAKSVPSNDKPSETPTSDIVTSDSSSVLSNPAIKKVESNVEQIPTDNSSSDPASNSSD